MKTQTHRNQRYYRLCFLIFCCLTSACTPIERIPERTMSVTVGPERVFQRPVAEFLPQLAAAVPTGINGRVGNELVFWGYRLTDNSDVNLFACAAEEDVDCEARIPAICTGNGRVLTRTTENGLVRHLNCRAVGVAGIGDLLPNCTDDEASNPLLVGLMQCR